MQPKQNFSTILKGWIYSINKWTIGIHQKLKQHNITGKSDSGMFVVVMSQGEKGEKTTVNKAILICAIKPGKIKLMQCDLTNYPKLGLWLNKGIILARQ